MKSEIRRSQLQTNPKLQTPYSHALGNDCFRPTKQRRLGLVVKGPGESPAGMFETLHRGGGGVEPQMLTVVLRDDPKDQSET